MAESHTLRPDFQYRYDNPYAERMKRECGELVLLDNHGESFRGKWNESVFCNSAPLHVELGSGYGHFLQELVTRRSDINVVGIDFRFKRSYQLSRKLKQLGVGNLRYLRARAERIHFLFGKAEVDELYLFFPDPWPKKRHHKKRLFTPDFLSHCAQVVKRNGRFLVKTDHEEYFQSMLEASGQHPEWSTKWKSFDLYRDGHTELSSFQTKFERIFLAKGNPIFALELARN